MSDNIEYKDQMIIPVDIESEMKKSFIDYAMSVIADRALPDVRDGLKPVHRRILYTMHLAGLTPSKAYRKSATTVGDVLGKFHPHGDAAVYESMVRMAQNFALRAPLVDGHGNFGSRDGDSAAAYRYTEARLARISLEMLSDINKNTVDFKPNYDDREMEPVVLPSRFPNLLVNGSSGIAVGMTTNIPPHNLGEVIDAVEMLIDKPETSIEELNEVIPGPDFPTAGIIVGKRGIRDAYATGKGRIVIRSRTEIEPFKNNRERIIVTELPYQVNKARLIEKMADLVKDKKVDGIADLRDESDRKSDVRIVIELKRDANANVVLNQLYKHSQLQDSFSINMLALVEVEKGRFEPKIMNLKKMLEHYISHQKDVVSRRTAFELEKAEARAHILEGLKIAIDNLDEVIRIIRKADTEETARNGLKEAFKLSDKQAQAIVDMRLGRLTGLEREKLEKELEDTLEKIKYLKSILADEKILLNIIKEELQVIRNKFADNRRSEIIVDEDDFDLEDLIKEEDIVVTRTHYGYVKRLPMDTYRSQRRGGKGVTGHSTKEEDFVEDLFITTTHHFILFFTNTGRVYKLKGYQIPEAGRQAKGTAIVNLLNLEPGEKIATVIPVRGFDDDVNLVMSTKYGIIKKTRIKEYVNIRKGGIQAIILKDDDEVIEVRLTDGEKDIMIVTKNGMSIRFLEKDIRTSGRVSQGVIGIRLDEDDYVVSMAAFIEDTNVLCVTENGFGKRTEFDEYKIQNRGGKGILTYRVTEKTGQLAGMKLVRDIDDIILINTDGTIIRMPVMGISILGRATQGVTLMRTSSDSSVVGIARVIKEDEEEQIEPEEEE
jgi:DNA gyrase subunit A